MAHNKARMTTQNSRLSLNVDAPDLRKDDWIHFGFQLDSVQEVEHYGEHLVRLRLRHIGVVYVERTRTFTVDVRQPLARTS